MEVLRQVGDVEGAQFREVRRLGEDALREREDQHEHAHADVEDRLDEERRGDRRIARARDRGARQEQLDHVAAARRHHVVEADRREVGAPHAPPLEGDGRVGGAQAVEERARAQREVEPEEHEPSSSASQCTAARSEKNCPAAFRNELMLWPIEVDARVAVTVSAYGAGGRPERRARRGRRCPGASCSISPSWSPVSWITTAWPLLLDTTTHERRGTRARPVRLLRLRRRGGGGAHDRPRRGLDAQLALGDQWRRSRAARARRDRRGGRPGDHEPADRPAARARGRSAADLRSAVAAQGDPALGRCEGQARRAGAPTGRRRTRRSPPAGRGRASTDTPSPSPSRACCSRGSRSPSSCSPSAPTSTRSRSRRRQPALRCCVVVAAGFAAAAPLARVPENTLKFGVGVMLSSFGIFWGAEGAGAHWPGGDAALLAIIPGLLLVSIAMARAMRRAATPAPGESAPATGEAPRPASAGA